MHIVHQHLENVHAKLLERMPSGVRLTQLPADDPWAVPRDAEVLLVREGTMKLLDPSTAPFWAAGLRWLHLPSTGIDNVPDWLLAIETVTTSRGAPAPAIAEYVLASMLTLEMGMPDIWMRSPNDRRIRSAGGLTGKSLGLVGFGEIGAEIALRALPFGMTVMAVRRSSMSSGIQGVKMADLESVLSISDHVVLCLPLTGRTRGLIDAAALNQMRLGSHLINVSRGAIVDEDAVRLALDAGRPAALTTDVWSVEPPPAGHWIYSHRGVRISPHLSFRGPSTERRLETILLRNVEDWLEGQVDRLHGLVSKEAGY